MNLAPLIVLAQRGDEEAIERLLQCFDRLIWKYSIFGVSYDWEDHRQELRMTFIRSVERFII